MSAEIDRLREENARLKAYINSITTSPCILENGSSSDLPTTTTASLENLWDGVGHGLSKEQVARYSRQIILPSFGVQGTQCN